MRRNHTPQVYELTLAAGARLTVHDYNRMVTFVDITAGHSLEWAVGDEPTVEAIEGISYELPEDTHADRLRLYNGGAASVTVKLVLSEGRIFDNRVNLSSYLESINDRLAGESSGTQLDDTTLAATGSTGTLIFAANAARKKAVIQACETNGDYVYLGFTAAGVSDVKKIAFLPAMGSIVIDYYQGAIYGVGGTAGQKVCGYEV